MALPQSLEPISNAVHLSIDMQNLFSAGGIWATPWMERVLPAIVAVAELIHELERHMRRRDCSEMRGYRYKRGHLVALRSTKISANDPPSIW
jgi:hypothetical protein